MMDCYKLGKDGKTPVPVNSLNELSSWKNDRTVKKDVFKFKGEKITVSTVFLMIDHSWDDGPPILFETMIFGGEHDEYQERYATWDDAVEGHQRALNLVKDL